MASHVIVSSYLGDYELDVGVTARWHYSLFDTLYARDVNLGDRTRNHLVAWDKSFPNTKFSYSNKSFFGPEGSVSTDNAADWRQKSFLKAMSSFGYGSDDWVFFLDASEAIVFDLQSGDLDPYEFVPGDGFLGLWIDQVVAAAAPTQDTISFPFWAYTRSSAPWNADNIIDPYLESLADGLGAGETFQGMTADEIRRMNTATYQLNYLYYTPAGRLPRAFKVSALLEPGFDWSSLDTFVEADTHGVDVGVSLVSYAYARYSTQDHIDPTTGGAADEASDLGWETRKLISRVRPIAGLQTDSWSDPDTADPEYASAMPINPDTGLPYAPPGSAQGAGTVEGDFQQGEFSSDFFSFLRRLVEVPTDPWPDAYEIDTPVYNWTPFRKNPRDGLFYLSGQAGDVPWNFISNLPAVDPATWAQQ